MACVGDAQAATDSAHCDDTVADMAAANGLRQMHQRRRLSERLGLIDALESDPMLEPATAVELPRVSAARPKGWLTFPMGCHERRIDEQGRINVACPASPDTPAVSPCELLGWEPGELRLAMVDGWAVISQPRTSACRQARRGSSHPNFSVDRKGPRVQLRTGHLAALGVTDWRKVVVVPVPDAHALLLVTPDALLSPEPPPQHVVTLLLTGVSGAVEFEFPDQPDTQKETPS